MSREDQSVVAALIEVCKKQGVTCLLQVGAEDGTEGLAVQEATKCRLVAFEPDLDCQPADPTMQFVRFAVGATDCVMPFYVHENKGLSTQFPRGGKETAVTVSQVRLDTFCTMHGLKPDGLIIDTEGTTLDVLEGCGDLLDGIRFIYAECQVEVLRLGMRLVGEVDLFLVERGFTQHQGAPSYGCGGQGNYTWVK